MRSVFHRIAEALERQVQLMERDVQERSEARKQPRPDDDVADPEYREAIIRASKAQEALVKQNAETMQRRAEWEQVEREHMAICEKRHHERMRDESDDTIN